MEAFETALGPAIRGMKDENGLDAFFPISRDYFVVYPANAAMLGHIEDPLLRKQIVVVYIAMQSMIDTIHLNNSLRGALEQAARNFILQGASAPPAAKMDADAAKRNLAGYGPSVKGMFNTVIDEIEEFFSASNRWLVKHGMPENPAPTLPKAS